MHEAIVRANELLASDELEDHVRDCIQELVDLANEQDSEIEGLWEEKAGEDI